MNKPEEPKGVAVFALRQVDGRGDFSNCDSEMELRARKRARGEREAGLHGARRGMGRNDQPHVPPVVALSMGWAGPSRVLGGPLLPVLFVLIVPVPPAKMGTYGPVCSMGHEKYCRQLQKIWAGPAGNHSLSNFLSALLPGARVEMFPLCVWGLDGDRKVQRTWPTGKGPIASSRSSQ